MVKYLGAVLSSRMRIVHVSPELQFGGSDRVMMAIASHQYECGHDVYVAVSGMEQRLPAWYDEDQHLPVERISYLGNSNRYTNPLDLGGQTQRLRKFLESRATQVVHSHLWTADLLTALACAPRTQTHFSHIHCGSGWMRSTKLRHRIRRGMTRIALNRARTTFIAVSAQTAEFEREAMGWSPDRMAIVPNGINTEFFRPRRATRPTRDSCCIGTAGWFFGVKGHKYLIEAVGTLLKSGQRVRLLVAGKGPLEEEYRKQISQNGMGDFVEIRSDVVDMRAFYEELDIFVLPSLSEAMPMALLEAMSMGKAVVATDVGGISEVIQDHQCGVLVAPSDPAAITRTLSNLIINKQKRLALGKCARERICGHFDINQTFYLLDRVYASHC